MTALATTPAFSHTVDFDDAKPGELPANWTGTKTGKGDPKWTVEKDDTAPSKPNVLKQSGEATFPICLKNDTSLKDGFVEVKFKAMSGKEDQAGGVVWRAKDADNYYLCRANALEDNVVLYKVEGGKRISLAPKGTPSKTYGAKQRVPKQTWSTLKVSFDGPRFEVFFDGARIMEVEDQTFSGRGKTGFWTKADSVTYFDDFQIEKKN